MKIPLINTVIVNPNPHDHQCYHYYCMDYLVNGTVMVLLTIMVLTIITTNQWPFQEPKLEVPTIYKAYVREYPHKIWPYIVQYLHFKILKFPLN